MLLSSIVLSFGLNFAHAAPRAKPFYAAAGSIDITPDLNAESTWMAGFGASGRRPQGIHDPLYARALVVSDGNKKVALVAVDNIGLYREEVEAIRRELGWDGEHSYLFLAATHTHSGPDTVGLWGRFPAISGINQRYQKRLRDSVVKLVREVSSRLQEAHLRAASVAVNPHGLCRDARDPIVIDPELASMQLKSADGSTLGTLVRYACHPEVLGSYNRMISADFPGALCNRIEEKTGGSCVYFSGAIGGLMTPDTDRSQRSDKEFAEVKRVGSRLAELVLIALARSHESLARPQVSWTSRLVRIPVENSRYLLFLPNLVFGHRLFDSQGNVLGPLSPYWLAARQLFFFPLPPQARPRIETEVSRVRIGPVDILGVPGELFPELAIGGYDGRYRFGYPLTNPANPNPPNLSHAPQGPYLRDRLAAKVGIIIGLANDELGYIIPPYDFQIAPNRSLVPRPAGTHYEETNSIGVSATEILLQAYAELLRP